MKRACAGHAVKTLAIRMSFALILPLTLLTSFPLLAQNTYFKVGTAVDAIFYDGEILLG